MYTGLTVLLLFQALGNFLQNNSDPEILVMSNAVWSLYCKPNQTMALEEYYVGLQKFVPVNTERQRDRETERHRETQRKGDNDTKNQINIERQRYKEMMRRRGR